MTEERFKELSKKANYSFVVADDYASENKGKFYRSFIVDESNNQLFSNESEVDQFLEHVANKFDVL